MTTDVKPTRSELIALKKRTKLASSGYNLLKKKRDGMILDFFEILKEAKKLRGDLVALYKEALEKMNKARVIVGDLEVRSTALAMANKPSVELGKKNIMGVVVPQITTEGTLQKTFGDRGPGAFISPAVSEAAQAFEKLVEQIIKSAEIEITLKRLLEEIEKTKRRVNALEFEVIPKMKKTQNFIKLRLEEMERENVFRMKRIKK